MARLTAALSSRFGDKALTAATFLKAPLSERFGGSSPPALYFSAEPTRPASAPFLSMAATPPATDEPRQCGHFFLTEKNIVGGITFSAPVS